MYRLTVNFQCDTINVIRYTYKTNIKGCEDIWNELLRFITLQKMKLLLK